MPDYIEVLLSGNYVARSYGGTYLIYQYGGKLWLISRVGSISPMLPETEQSYFNR